MKKLFGFLAIAALIFSAIAANATPRAAGVQPSSDTNGNVTIPDLPHGKLLQVYVWNDCNGSRARLLGPVHSFKLADPCDSFNFTWSDGSHVYWQMVTPSTKPGGALRAIYHPEGYKYGLPSANVNRH